MEENDPLIQSFDCNSRRLRLCPSGPRNSRKCVGACPDLLFLPSLLALIHDYSGAFFFWEFSLPLNWKKFMDPIPLWLSLMKCWG